MKTLSLVLLLTLAARAQDAQNAADIFYKAYWLEQSGHDAKQAEAMYETLLRDHGNAPEAPRAIVGLIRLRVKRGDDVAKLVAQLETYSDAKQERAQARRILTAPKHGFDPHRRPDDSPLDQALKDIYFRIMNVNTDSPINAQQRTLIIDLGVRAHAMLEAAMRSTNPTAVHTAASLALRGGAESKEFLRKCVADDSIVFRSAIFDAMVKQANGFHGPMLAELVRVWDSAPLRVKLAMLKLANRATAFGQFDFSYDILQKAMSSNDPKVQALLWMDPIRLSGPVPDALAALIVERIEKDGFELYSANGLIPLIRDDALAPRIQALLEKARLLPHHNGEYDDATVRVLVRSGLNRFLAGDDSVVGALRSYKSNRVAQLEIVAACLKHHRGDLMQRIGGGSARWKVGELRGRAIQAMYSTNKKEAEAATAVITRIRVTPSEWPKIRELALRHKHIHAYLIQAGGMNGPSELIPIVPLADTEEKVRGLLAYASHYSDNFPLDDRRKLVAQVLERATPASGDLLFALASKRDYVDLVVQRMLRATGKEWNWISGKYSAIKIVTQAWRTKDLVGPLFYAHADDPRAIIGELAIDHARRIQTPEASAALALALKSPHSKVVRAALKALKARSASEMRPIFELLRSEPFAKDAYDAIEDGGHLSHTGAIEAQLPHVTDRLARKAWSCLESLDPKRAATLAFEGVKVGRSRAYRLAALDVLARSNDPRRMDIFRRVLSEDQDKMLAGGEVIVLRAIGDQYLHELGPQILQYLRHPDPRVSNTAHGAIKRIQFYVEAKKILESAADRERVREIEERVEKEAGDK